MNERHDDLQEIIDAALREMAAEEGDGFDPQACNLAEFCRRTGLTRSRARTVRAHGFRALPHGNSGRRTASGVLAGHTGLVDDLLRKGVINSQVIFVSVNLFFTSFAKQARRSRKGGFTGCANVFSPIPVTA